MKKLRVCLLVLAAAMAAGPAFAQEAGKWSHSGLFEGSSQIGFGNGGTIGESFDDARITSTPGTALFKIQYAKRLWDINFGFGANETGNSKIIFNLNWMTDWAGFKASTSLGLSELVMDKQPSMDTLAASKLHIWFYPVDRQLEMRFTYNDNTGEVYKITWVERNVDTGPSALGPADSSYPFRFVVSPNIFPVKFGASMPLPRAALKQDLALGDEFLWKTHFFAGADLSNLTLRAGYWAVPKDTDGSKAVLYAKIGGLPFGLNLAEVLQPNGLSNWEGDGNLNNRLILGGIPLPLIDTVKLTAIHILNYRVKTERMSNEILLSSDFKAGPVQLKPWVSYFMNEMMNQIDSGLDAEYKLTPLFGLEGSGLTAKLIAGETGVHTVPAGADTQPFTIITVEPRLDFWIRVIPNWLLFQTSPSVPFKMNLGDSEQDTAQFKCKVMFLLNLKSGGLAFDTEWNGETNTIWLSYDAGYDLKNDVVAGGSMSLGFKVQW